jgi:hypothetical protein
VQWLVARPAGEPTAAYRELLARYFLSLNDHQVDAIHEIEAGLVEITLRPLGRRIDPGNQAGGVLPIGRGL